MIPSNGPQSGSIPSQLDIVGLPPSRIRADAQRNNAKVMDAARRLVASRGLSAVTMDEIAQAAGVGKGTVFRVVGSRAGLAEALLDDAERDLQYRLLQGDAPLGPAAPAGQRLVEFVSAYVDFLDDNVELLLETERGGQGARFHVGAYTFWHAHVTHLLRELGHADPALLAHSLLAPLSADLYHHLRAHVNATKDTLRATLVGLVSTVIDG